MKAEIEEEKTSDDNKVVVEYELRPVEHVIDLSCSLMTENLKFSR
jgi:hypothetical protein